MEEIKKEENQPVVEETLTMSKTEIENLINKKAIEIFGDLVKELNKPKVEEVKEEVKELTIEDYSF